MNYRRDRYGNELSILGYGCMRFTQKAGRIDLDKAQEELLFAYGNGVNYYDTAYIYPGSEAALGEIFERTGIRDKIYIATKLPHYLIKSVDSAEKYLQEQLKRLRTDHIDYYLMHMLSDDRTWERLVEMGVGDWLRKKQQEGSIRQIGFSYHGNSDTFIRLVDAWDWDFCQIQYNYLDEHSQAGRTGFEHAAAKGIPVVIMEPLRGGKLVRDLPEKALKAFASAKVQRTPAQWGLKWLWDQPGVTCVLSGMNSLEMIDENCRVASEVVPGQLTEDDFALLAQVCDAINARVRVGCTGCGYCMPCPQGVDIPALFRCYNHMYTESKASGRKEYWQTVSLRKTKAFARQCVGCGKCERHCPQGIEIRKQIHIADRELRPLPWRIAGDVARNFAVRG